MTCLLHLIAMVVHFYLKMTDDWKHEENGSVSHFEIDCHEDDGNYGCALKMKEAHLTFSDVHCDREIHGFLLLSLVAHGGHGAREHSMELKGKNEDLNLKVLGAKRVYPTRSG